MAASSKAPNLVQSLQEEAVCPICLDYFTDPVSIPCGHNFCRMCVTQLWGGEDGEGRVELDPEEEEEEEEEEGGSGGEEEEVEAAGAGGGWDTNMRDENSEGDLEEEVEEEEEGVFGNRDMGGYNWGNVDVREEEEYDDDDHSHDDDGLGVEVDEVLLEEDEEEELYLLPDPRQYFTCPQCRKSFPSRDFRPNLQLANMVEVIRKMHPGLGQGSPGNEQGICPQHQEALTLYCEVDGEAICVLCQESRSHKHHSVVPLEDVVKEYKAKLQGHVKPLMKHLKAVEKMKAKEERRVMELNSQMHLELAAVASEFGQLTRFLAVEQSRLEQRLREMHEAQLGQAEAAASLLAERATQLSRLLNKAQEQSHQGALPLLQDIKETFNRCEEIPRQPREIWPPDSYHRHNHDFLTDIIMRKMNRLFCQAVRVDLRLDPDTAHPALMLSPDRRQVHLAECWQEVADYSNRFLDDYCVLGAHSFRSGCHYWEVEVSGQQGWAVGAVRESSHHEEMGSGDYFLGTGDASSSSGHHHCLNLPQQPLHQREVWCVGTNGNSYQAQSSTEQRLLSPRETPRRFGVYLDYEARRLDFYNAETLAHVHTFSAAFLGERVFPFFRVFTKGTEIKLCL